MPRWHRRSRRRNSVAPVPSEWSDPGRVAEYLSREIPHRSTAEEMLLEALPPRVERFLDLGTGDGRLLALVRDRHPDAVAIGLDSSAPMLARAAERFEGDSLVELHTHDLGLPLAVPGPFDAVVSGLAIHHLKDVRKRGLFGEIHALLAPGGVFGNLDLVQPASTQLHERFRREIGPLAELRDWIEEARAEGVPQPASVAFVTVSAKGRPSARTVSLKRLEEDALVFTSALWTRKVREIEANPTSRCSSSGQG